MCLAILLFSRIEVAFLSLDYAQGPNARVLGSKLNKPMLQPQIVQHDLNTALSFRLEIKTRKSDASPIPIIHF